jgi:hypothetical protein
VVSSGKSKVGEFTGHAFVGDQHILRLQIPVVNSDGMTVLHGIQNLKKGSLDKIIIANILALLSDVREQITFWAVLDYDISAIWGVHNLDQGDYVGVSAGLMVELDLPLLELLLPWLKANLVECFHRIWDIGVHIQCSVNNSVCSNTENASELEPTSKYLS